MKIRERTFVMIKPDAVQRLLVGEIINRLEKKGLKLAALKMIKICLLYTSYFFSLKILTLQLSKLIIVSETYHTIS